MNRRIEFYDVCFALKADIDSTDVKRRLKPSAHEVPPIPDARRRPRAPSPEVVEAILDGRQLKGLKLSALLRKLPVPWEEQRSHWIWPSQRAAMSDLEGRAAASLVALQAAV